MGSRERWLIAAALSLAATARAQDSQECSGAQLAPVWRAGVVPDSAPTH